MVKKISFAIIGISTLVCLCFLNRNVIGYIGYTTDNNITIKDVHFYIDGEIVYRGNLYTDFMHNPNDTFTLNLNIGIHDFEVWLPNERIRQSKKIFYLGSRYMVIDFIPQNKWKSEPSIFWIDTSNEFPLK